jgi:4-oxalocrotonate tautomerase family enzyme
MPVVTVNTRKQNDIEKKRKLVKKITDALNEVYGVPKEHVTIQLREDNDEDIGIGGVLLADMQR